ncbi:hypothetical protein [Mycobacteroides abscessus]|uniref:hypothetical protein n=1 Tax=Mycobacteroides abscessus TaxID=36809 RepID=UPI0009445914|nr:hypothetical protein [Mycobacteroides abscessus]MBN7561832.1 hypothetical protein [Mycobacteroides abscessus subsp. abscessus]MCU8690479.1 hypothetical protein [Mycobacteroides abscessus]MCU8709688.1 hypothetical protein [Mycobacteroides abscessus]MCU8714386.1 hypothetical protein [Mycobacteroides abscessus]MCU8748448.1 hypothetical protein [Mycobacteroides abscessus]
MALMWLREQFKRLQLKRLWQVVTIAVLAATAAFGGLEEAPTVKPVELGKIYANGALDIIPHALVAGCRKIPFSFAYAIPDDQSVVILRATIESVIDEDLGFDGNADYKLFELKVDDTNKAPIGVIPEGGQSPVDEIAAGTKMVVGIMWQVPNKWLERTRTATVILGDLEKKAQEFIPVVKWVKADRDIHGELTTHLGEC